jgi:hypothetical protein
MEMYMYFTNTRGIKESTKRMCTIGTFVHISWPNWWPLKNVKKGALNCIEPSSADIFY